MPQATFSYYFSCRLGFFRNQSPFTYNWDARSTLNAGAFDVVLSDKAAAVSAPYLIPKLYV
jgi:hypothetical protein